MQSREADGILRRRLLRFEALLPSRAVVAREPERDEEHERGARAHRADVVRPRGAQEARVPIVLRGHDGNHGRARQICPATETPHVSVRDAKE